MKRNELEKIGHMEEGRKYFLVADAIEIGLHDILIEDTGLFDDIVDPRNEEYIIPIDEDREIVSEFSERLDDVDTEKIGVLEYGDDRFTMKMYRLFFFAYECIDRADASGMMERTQGKLDKFDYPIGLFGQEYGDYRDLVESKWRMLRKEE